MKSYRVKFNNYLDDLAKKVPSPGGGSVVCLVFCMGVSLIEKAMLYSLDKNKELRKYLIIFKNMKKKIYPYIDLDGKIFSEILKAKGKERDEFIKHAEDIIIDTAESSISVFSLAKKIEFGIKKSIISDFLIGIELIKITLRGCVFNLEANIKMFGIKSRFIGIFKKHINRW